MNTEFLNTPIVVDVGGKERGMQFNANAHIAFEEATGENLLGLIVRMRTKPHETNMRALRALVWASLITNDPQLTPEQVGAWLTMRVFRDIAESLSEALKQYLPEVSAAEAADANPSQAPTTTTNGTASIGADSGASASSISDSTPNSSDI